MDAKAVVEVAPLVRTEVDLDSVGQAGNEPVLESGEGTKFNKIDQIGRGKLSNQKSLKLWIT